jgi:hypothetical protein
MAADGLVPSTMTTIASKFPRIDFEGRLQFVLVLKRIGITFVCFGAIIFLFATARRVTASRSSNTLGRNAPVLPQQTPLEKAKTEIPVTLKTIYSALNQGNPAGAASVVSPEILRDSKTLDFICRPFTFRAFYVEAIVERPGPVFQTRVRVLFQPMEEHAHTMMFRTVSGRSILQSVEETGDDWFQPWKQQAIEAGRKFIYAAMADKREVMQGLVSSKLDISPLYTNSNYIERLQDLSVVDDKPQVNFVQHHGLKLHVTLSANKKSYCYEEWNLLFDDVGDSFCIVSWEFAPPNFCLFAWGLGFHPVVTEDPNLEAYTLKRFGLSKKPPASQ